MINHDTIFRQRMGRTGVSLLEFTTWEKVNLVLNYIIILLNKVYHVCKLPSRSLSESLPLGSKVYAREVNFLDKLVLGVYPSGKLFFIRELVSYMESLPKRGQ